MTERKALEICLELWQWLAMTGDENKSSWPGWNEYGQMRADCPCCEYVFVTLRSVYTDCSRCPLLKFWGSGIRRFDFCLNAGSPYYKWDTGELHELKQAAQGMVAIIKQALAELKD